MELKRYTVGISLQWETDINVRNEFLQIHAKTEARRGSKSIRVRYAWRAMAVHILKG